MASNSAYSKSPGKSMKSLKGSLNKTPNINTIKNMSRQEKIELLNQLNNGSPSKSKSPTKGLGGTTKKARPSSGMSSQGGFTTPARKKDPTKMRPMSASTPAILPLKFNANGPGPAPAPGPKQEPMTLTALVNLKDRLSS
jgi:hypothetical protein